MKLEGKNLQEVHKLVYLVKEYPEQTVRQIGELFVLSTMDINATIHRAQDAGFIKVDKETLEVELLDTPKAWHFGPEVDHLLETIPYVFGKLVDDEADLEENSLSAWLAGHPSQDAMVALRKLTNEGVLATYELTTVNEPAKKATKKAADKAKPEESTYLFYTLAENLEKEWGRKQFPDQSKLK